MIETSTSRYVGVVLAAGQGKRMGALGEQYPKALLPVGGDSVIGHQLKLFRRLGIMQVYVVIGHLGARVIEEIGSGACYGLQVDYVEQGPPLGSAYALARVKKYLKTPFVVALGDYYFEAPEAERLIHGLDRHVSVITGRREPNAMLLMEACELQIADDGRLKGIHEKPSNLCGNLKGCGLYAFQPTFLDSLARTPRTALRDEYELSLAVDVHLSSGHEIYVEEIIQSNWNFTQPRDVLDCNMDWLDRQKLNVFLAGNAQINSDAVMERVVVGSGAVIQIPAIRNAVVFSGSNLQSGTALDGALVTPRGLFPI